MAAAGGATLFGLMDVMTAGKMAVYTDTTGAGIVAWQPGEHLGAELVNEPGALVWNEFNSGDLAKSRSFYSAVFGWAWGAPTNTPRPRSTAAPSARPCPGRFAVSGAIAGLAGVLFAYDQGNVVANAYSPEASIIVFLAAATAGISSLGRTVSGVMLLEISEVFQSKFNNLFGDWFGSFGHELASIMPELLTGPLLLASLYFYPGGSAQNGFDQRDNWLRRVADRRNLLVPSLVADRRVSEDGLIVDAERRVEEVTE